MGGFGVPHLDAGREVLAPAALHPLGDLGRAPELVGEAGAKARIDGDRRLEDDAVAACAARRSPSSGSSASDVASITRHPGQNTSTARTPRGRSEA
jgi:hypothetical protein